MNIPLQMKIQQIMTIPDPKRTVYTLLQYCTCVPSDRESHCSLTDGQEVSFLLFKKLVVTAKRKLPYICDSCYS